MLVAYPPAHRIHRHAGLRIDAQLLGGHCADDDRSVSFLVLWTRGVRNGLRIVSTVGRRHTKEITKVKDTHNIE